jgi:membrane-bound metal-dependent hydrolase YbcI (DUF457 family)
VATTLGHTLAGAVLAEWTARRPRGAPVSRRTALVLCCVLANLPDLDFLASYLIIGDPRRLHGGVTHTLLFVLVGSLLFAVGRWFGSFGRTFVLGGMALGSHLVLDFFAGQSLGVADGWGVMLFYPFSESRLESPVKLLFGARHRDVRALLSRENAFALLWEAAVFLPLLWLSARNPRRSVESAP